MTPHPMLSRLPSLTGLRAFVVTARHASFGGAARELHVSTTAVGQQIRGLEAQLGGALFERVKGRLVLTPLGAALVPELDAAFGRIAAAVARSAAPPQPRVLRLAVSAGVARHWLLPRLEALHRALDPLGLQVLTVAPGTSPPEGAAGLLAHMAPPVAPPAGARLMQEALSPLCSPAFARRHRLAERGPQAVPEVTLLHNSGADYGAGAPGWQDWLRRALPASAATPATGQIPAGPILDESLALDAALEGAGLCLGPLRLARHHLAAGRLVQPFATAVPVAGGYHLLGAAGQPGLVRLLDWLRAELASPAPWPGSGPLTRSA